MDRVNIASASGGWEVWLQLELYFHFLNKIRLSGSSSVCRREVTNIWPYSPQDRIDFWFKWDEVSPDMTLHEHSGIELKCRSASETPAAFAMRFLGDFTKCAQQPDLATHGSTLLSAVGITRDANDVKSFNFNSWENTFYTSVVAVESTASVKAPNPPGRAVPVPALPAAVRISDATPDTIFIIWRTMSYWPALSSGQFSREGTYHREPFASNAEEFKSFKGFNGKTPPEWS